MNRKIKTGKERFGQCSSYQCIASQPQPHCFAAGFYTHFSFAAGAMLHFVSRGRQRDIAGGRGSFFKFTY